MRRLPIPIVLAVVLTMVLSTMALAGGQATDVGTLGNPVRLSVQSSSGDLDAQLMLADALHEATGLEFVVQVPADAEEAVEWMCGEFSDSMTRFAGSAEYVFADELCGADTRLQLVGDGVYGYQGQFLVPMNSDLYTLDDLDGLDWYHPGRTSLSGYVAALAMLMMTGVDGYTAIDAGNHTNAVQAVYDNAVSENEIPVFATTFADARFTIFDEHPDVYDRLRVLAEYPVIPNSPVVFGPDFPAQLRRQIEKALVNLADPNGPNYDIWEKSIGELTSATDLDKVKKKDFDFLKAALEASEIGIGDL